jgi:hypothetical protein
MRWLVRQWHRLHEWYVRNEGFPPGFDDISGRYRGPGMQ